MLISITVLGNPKLLNDESEFVCREVLAVSCSPSLSHVRDTKHCSSSSVFAKVVPALLVTGVVFFSNLKLCLH